MKAINAFVSLFHAKATSPDKDYSLGSKAIYYLSEGMPPSCDRPSGDEILKTQREVPIPNRQLKPNSIWSGCAPRQPYSVTP